MTEKKAEKDRFKEAIELHKKRGIDTYLFTCETGEKCLLREPTVRETGMLLPILNGFGINEKGKDNEPNPLEVGIRLVDICWIAGDAKIKKNDDLLCEVALSASNIINLKIADVKKN